MNVNKLEKPVYSGFDLSDCDSNKVSDTLKKLIDMPSDEFSEFVDETKTRLKALELFSQM